LMDLNQRSAPFSAVQESKMSTVMIMRGECAFAVPKGPGAQFQQLREAQEAGSRQQVARVTARARGERRAAQAAGSRQLAAGSSLSSLQPAAAAGSSSSSSSSSSSRARSPQTADSRATARSYSYSCAPPALCALPAACLLPVFACRRPRVRYTQGSGRARAQLEKSGGGSCLDLIANELPHA
jgi:hypothetical protein